MIWDGLRLLVFVAVLYGLAVVFVLQESYVQNQFEYERAAQHALLGDAAAYAAEARAQRLFARLVVNTGTMRDSFRDLVPAAAAPAPATAAHGGGGALAAGKAATPQPAVAPAAPGWLVQRMRVVWTILFVTMVRLSYALLWWPLLVLTLVPALVDAIAARKVKATTFALTSPQFQGFVMRALPLSLAGYFLWIVLPFAEPALTVPVGIALTVAMVWVGVSQFAKRG